MNETDLTSLSNEALINLIKERDSHIEELKFGTINEKDPEIIKIKSLVDKIVQSRGVTESKVWATLGVTKKSTPVQHTHHHPDDKTKTCKPSSSHQSGWFKAFLAEGNKEADLIEIAIAA